MPKAEAIEDSRESNISNNFIFKNIVAYLKSGKSSDSKPVIDGYIVNFDKYRWGMSIEEAKL